MDSYMFVEKQKAIYGNPLQTGKYRKNIGWVQKKLLLMKVRQDTNIIQDNNNNAVEHQQCK